MKKRYDQKTCDISFKEGQEVLLYDMSLLKQWSRKLEERWSGPYTVIWRGEMGSYGIDTGDGRVKTVSGDHLKGYNQRIRFC